MVRRCNYIIVFLIFFIPLVSQQAKGQEFPWSLQYITNMHTINPAFVGMWDKAGLLVSTRQDYVSIKGATMFQQLSYHSPIKNHESGYGLNITKRYVGLEKQLFFTGDYSYEIRFDMYNYMRFGLKAGILNYSNDLTRYHLYPDRITDPEFINDVHNYFMTVVGVGGVFYNDHLYVSLSAPRLINNTFRVTRSGFSSLQEFKTAYLAGGYVFNLPMSILLRPNLLVVGTIGKPVYFDAAAVLYLPNNLQLGLNLRSNGSTCLSGQYTFSNNIRIGFAADYAIFQDIRKFQLGTYEILVGYDFNIYRKAGRPNYF
jgi:type IX secretion system PorP/SprF family membrane protein